MSSTNVTRTHTFLANSLGEATKRLEDEFDTDIVVEPLPYSLTSETQFRGKNPHEHLAAEGWFQWAAKRAKAWGRIVPEGANGDRHLVVEVSVEEVDVEVDVVEFLTPQLTPEKLTAENALAMLPVGGIYGLCTPQMPWGEQGTGLLPDGTPVDSFRFPSQVLRVLAGHATAEEICEEWRKDVAETYGECSP